MVPRRPALSPLVLLSLLVPAACKDDVELAPKAEKLEEAAPKTEAATVFTVQAEGSAVSFEMQAPFERQEGTVPTQALSGSLHVDPHDLTKTTGLVMVDLAKLEIFMQKAEEEGDYGEREKSDVQNEHMRDWLEIGDDVPADVLKDNQRVEFSITEVKDVSTADVSAMEGAERTVTFTAGGEFLLHQRKSPKAVKMEATFHYQGDTPTTVEVRTVEPFAVGLAEHDVRPRTGFGTLAQKTLSTLSSKVAEEAQVSVSFTAVPAKG